MPIAVVETVAAVRAQLAAARAAGRTIALVPTMGALHAGHLALVARASELADLVVVSIFVNPLQFGPSEDLDRYPRTLDADVAELAASGVDVAFAPSVAEMYPDGSTTIRISAGEPGRLLEGAVRPGHFDGMLTVVAKLLNVVLPDIVVFGQKDAQQVFLVECMVDDLNIPVAVEVVETVREPDGLALSSRNRYLDAQSRVAAAGLFRALLAGKASASRGPAAALDAARAELERENLVETDYLALVEPRTFLPIPVGFRGGALMLVAARVGGTRLIDNLLIAVA